MIKSFKDGEVARIFDGEQSRKFPSTIMSAAQRKLTQLHAAVLITDLRSPPGNRLEKLKNDRAHQHSIRVNDQYRTCFTWKERQSDPESDKPQPGDAYDVEITDYH